MSIEARWLLASDMDGTVIPLEDTPEYRADVARFREAVTGRDNLLLAYVTGRDLDLAKKGIREFGLPVPDLLSCDVGTGVYRWDGTDFRPDEDYRDLMDVAMGGVAAGTIRGALTEIPGLRPQEDSRQGRYKVSFYLDDHPASEAPLARVREVLMDLGARASLVYSRDPLREVGLLDILPAGIAKDYAVRFLHDRTGVSEDRLLYAGDSGNDRAAMLSGYRVVVVGNAPDSLKRELLGEAAEVGLADRIYFARRAYAAGVLEGLRHWGLLGGAD